MKTKILLLFILGILATTGSTCINDGFLVAVNLPLTASFSIREGNNLAWTISDPGQPVVVTLKNQIDDSYVDHVKNVRYYDLKVGVSGAYTGSISGICYINNLPLLTFSGTWKQFADTTQSLLGSSTHITPQASGLAELLRVLNVFRTTPTTTASFSSSGSLSGQSPVPAGLKVNLEILAQVDAEVK
jgi:hypothetical protein